MPNIRTADYRREFADALASAASADIAVAFASFAGLQHRNIERILSALLQAGGRVRILLDLRLGNTDPDFVDRVLGWSKTGLLIECRHYEPENGLFHPKLYIFHLRDGTARVVSGSANWTGEAYAANVEHGIVLEGGLDDSVIAEARRFFDRLWASPNARLIDQPVKAELRHGCSQSVLDPSRVLKNGIDLDRATP